MVSTKEPMLNLTQIFGIASSFMIDSKASARSGLATRTVAFAIVKQWRSVVPTSRQWTQ